LRREDLDLPRKAGILGGGGPLGRRYETLAIFSPGLRPSLEETTAFSPHGHCLTCARQRHTAPMATRSGKANRAGNHGSCTRYAAKAAPGRSTDNPVPKTSCVPSLKEPLLSRVVSADCIAWVECVCVAWADDQRGPLGRTMWLRSNDISRFASPVVSADVVRLARALRSSSRGLFGRSCQCATVPRPVPSWTPADRFVTPALGRNFARHR